MSKKPVAVQLWTVRDDIARDMAGAFRQIAATGYQGVELWFPQFPPAEELKTMLDDCGLKAMGAHVPFLQLRDEFEAVAAYHRVLGNTDLAIPIIPEPLRRSEADWHERVKEIKAIAERCRAEGFRLSYHNHAVEFEAKVGAGDAHDFIFGSIGPELLQAELDTYFIQAVGKDPAAYIRRYASRLPLLHLKEQSKTVPNQQTELGRGTIDWDAVFAAAEQSCVEWYIVEQSPVDVPALESIRINHEFLRERGVA